VIIQDLSQDKCQQLITIICGIDLVVEKKSNK